MLAMLLIAEQRAAHQPTLALLSPRDIVEMLKETLPRKPDGKHALVARINQRHTRGAAPSWHAADHSQNRLPAREIIPYKVTLLQFHVEAPHPARRTIGMGRGH